MSGMTPETDLTAKIAEAIGAHQRITTRPGGPCLCDRWPDRQNHDEQGWHEHVAEVLAEAGLIRDPSAVAIARAAWYEGAQAATDWIKSGAWLATMPENPYGEPVPDWIEALAASDGSCVGYPPPQSDLVSRPGEQP